MRCGLFVSCRGAVGCHIAVLCKEISDKVRLYHAKDYAVGKKHKIAPVRTGEKSFEKKKNYIISQIPDCELSHITVREYYPKTKTV